VSARQSVLDQFASLFCPTKVVETRFGLIWLSDSDTLRIGVWLEGCIGVVTGTCGGWKCLTEREGWVRTFQCQ